MAHTNNPVRTIRRGLTATTLAAGVLGLGDSASAGLPAAMVATDVDSDGFADIAGADINGDGFLDVVAADLDLDGVAETVAITGEVAAESAGDLAEAGGSVIEALLGLLGF